MNSLTLWKLFTATGSISAYLQYRNLAIQEEEEEAVDYSHQGG